MFAPNANRAALVRPIVVTAIAVSTSGGLVEQGVGAHRRAHVSNSCQRVGMAAPRPLHVPPGREAQASRDAVEKCWKQKAGQSPPRRLDLQWCTLAGQLREVIDQGWMGIENFFDGFS